MGGGGVKTDFLAVTTKRHLNNTQHSHLDCIIMTEVCSWHRMQGIWQCVYAYSSLPQTPALLYVEELELNQRKNLWACLTVFL